MRSCYVRYPSDFYSQSEFRKDGASSPGRSIWHIAECLTSEWGYYYYPLQTAKNSAVSMYAFLRARPVYGKTDAIAGCIQTARHIARPNTAIPESKPPPLVDEWMDCNCVKSGRLGPLVRCRVFRNGYRISLFRRVACVGDNRAARCSLSDLSEKWRSGGAT